jgi:hypothetical protein
MNKFIKDIYFIVFGFISFSFISFCLVYKQKFIVNERYRSYLMLSVAMLSVVMLSVVMLNGVMLNASAPYQCVH